MTRLEKTHAHYVDNRMLTNELTAYAKLAKEITPDKARPRMSRFLVESIMKMSERLAMAPNFRNYTYIDEMKGAAIEATLKYMHNFNAEKYDNAFAYISQIMFAAMVQVIKKEKKHEKQQLLMIQQMVCSWMVEGAQETELADLARHIADQKLDDMEKSKLTGEAKSRAGGSRKTTTRPKKKEKVNE